MITDEWLTPREILAPLGVFDLDPCAPAVRPWDTAAKHYSLPIDGLREPWFGRVWLNPPFGAEAAYWLEKMAAHGNGIALVAARTETKSFYSYIWGAADAVLFVRGRPHFCGLDGWPAKANSGAPIALVAYGSDNVLALNESGLGVTVLWHDVKGGDRMNDVEYQKMRTTCQGRYVNYDDHQLLKLQLDYLLQELREIADMDPASDIAKRAIAAIAKVSLKRVGA